MKKVSDEQADFLECVKPLMQSIPESKKHISMKTGVPVTKINKFLLSKETIDTHDLQKLFEYFNCSYNLESTHDGHEYNDFRLNGGYTTFPKGKKQIVELYDSVSHGGDLVFACQLLYQSGDIASHTRYILLHTCYFLYTLMVIKDQADIIDKLIDQDKLINFDGDRVCSDELFQAIDQHIYNINTSPHLRPALDLAFFADKDLVFSQLPLSRMD
ncbi:MAG: hypothetical protein HRU20_24750 [Pseudomonadales bacterium]|nr:hypothetical protein [Pseudomonadales bacterium]